MSIRNPPYIVCGYITGSETKEKQGNNNIHFGIMWERDALGRGKWAPKMLVMLYLVNLAADT